MWSVIVAVSGLYKAVDGARIGSSRLIYHGERGSVLFG